MIRVFMVLIMNKITVLDMNEFINTLIHEYKYRPINQLVVAYYVHNNKLIYSSNINLLS